MGFRPLTAQEQAGIAASIKKIADAEAAAPVKPASAAAAPVAVNDQITDAVTAETPVESADADAKPAGKNPFKRKL